MSSTLQFLHKSARHESQNVYTSLSPPRQTRAGDATMKDEYTEDEYHGKLDVKMWTAIVRRAMRYRRSVIALCCTAVAAAIGDSSFALLTKFVIDEAVDRGLGPGLWKWIAAYGFMVAFLCFFVWLFIYNAGKISRYLSHDIRKECFDKLQDLSFAYYDARPVGWLMSRITSDCDRLAQIIAWGLTDLLWGMLIIIIMSVVMFIINWKLALIVIGVVMPLIFVSKFFHKRILLTARKIRKTYSEMTAAYNESLMGVRTTKTLVREKDNLDEFGKLSTEMHGHSMRLATLSSIYLPIVTTTGAVAAGLALWHGGGQAIQHAITLGTLVMFINYATQFFGPIGQMARIITEMQGAQSAGERVMSLLNTVPEIKDSEEVVKRMQAQLAGAALDSPPSQGGVRGRSGERIPETLVAPADQRQDARPTLPPPLPEREGSRTNPQSAIRDPQSLAPDGHPHHINTIEFRNLSFAYSNGRPVLTDFNLRVEAGQTIALVGPTGGGKSTIVSLVCRFYEPTRGSVLINGVDYRERSLHWLQSNLGIVLQAPHLFSGTVRENIRFGRLDATNEEIEQAAKLVRAHDFIQELDRGYDSEVGQGGSRLSTGQKQLLSFARAIIANPQVFVMDEATSSIDTHTEHVIQQGLEAILQGRISFVIAHRLSTIRRADVILFIDGGRVVEQGNHRDLIKKHGRYFDLYTSHSKLEREVHAFE
ncbi:MAG: ABC transporter ATP-binding protein [Phycisphaeraceae bacterium]